MEDYKHRKRAKIAGFVDLGVVLLSIVGTIVFAVVLAPLFLHAESSKVFQDLFSSYGIHNASEIRKQASTIIRYIWITSAVDCLVAGVQCVAAVLLINAAALGRNPRRSIKRVLFWMILNIIVLIVYTIWRIIDRFWITLVLVPIFRLVLIYFVFRFMSQLRRLSAVPELKVPKKLKVHRKRNKRDKHRPREQDWGRVEN